MKILVSSINFYPDHSGIALYATDLPVFFAEQGQDVTMVTGFSYYPRWQKRKEDQGDLFRRESYHGVKVLRGYLYVPEKVSTLKRMIHDLSFLAFAFLNFLRAGKPDAIVVLTPPLLLGLIGVVFKKLWRTKLVVHIQDLQLDAAVSLGMLKKSLLTRILEKVERFTYQHSDLVIPITRGMKEVVLAKGVPAAKTFVAYNWIDVPEAARKGQKGGFIQGFPHLAQKFNIAYAGNIGIKQGVDILLKLAEATLNNPKIHYFIIGEGADKDRLIRLAGEKRLDNLTFHPFLDQEQYFNMLCDMDALFVSQQAKTGNVFFPSKLLGIMAKAKPILLSADLDSELGRFIADNGCGLVAAPGDLATLARHVQYLYDHPPELAALGQRCLATVQEFHRDRVLSSFLDKLEALVAVKR